MKLNIEELPNRHAWKDDIHWSESLNCNGDKIGIKLAPNTIQLYIKSGCSKKSTERKQYMEWYSQKIDEVYSKFDPFDSSCAHAPFEILKEKEKYAGRSSRIHRSWDRSDRDQWFAVAQWVRVHVKTLRKNYRTETIMFWLIGMPERAL